MLWRSRHHPTTMEHTNALTLMLITSEVQLCIVNKNLFDSSNIVLHNLYRHVILSLPDFSAHITLQPIPGLMLLTEVCSNPSLLYFVIHTTLRFRLLDELLANIHSPCSTLALASNIHTLLTSSPSHKDLFFPIIYQYHIRHSLPYTQHILFPYIVFECRHNIRNQPVSTAILSPSSFRDITTIGTFQHLGEVFSFVFSRQYGM